MVYQFTKFQVLYKVRRDSSKDGVWIAVIIQIYIALIQRWSNDLDRCEQFGMLRMCLWTNQCKRQRKNVATDPILCIWFYIYTFAKCCEYLISVIIVQKKVKSKKKIQTKLSKNHWNKNVQTYLYGGKMHENSFCVIFNAQS